MRPALGLIVVALIAGAAWAVWTGRAAPLANLLDIGALVGRTPHEDYTRRLRAAGLDDSPLARRWVEAAEAALMDATPVSLPHVEARWFPASAPSAIAFRASVKRGQRLAADARLESEAPMQLFVDLFEMTDDGLEHVASAGRDARQLSFDIRRDATYVMRVQPELLEDARVTVTWQVNPTLALPVEGATRSSIQSYFLAPRDGGRREHHGVDIFAPRGTPVVAAASGIVTSVGSNALGGNVVWVGRPLEGESHYYAHLDTQAVTPGTHVDAGDALGTVGTTGNARGGPPHLHFGIYAREPIDPLPYLAPSPAVAPLGPNGRLGNRARLTRATGLDAAVHQTGTIVDIVGVVPGRLRVRLPDGTEGYVRPSAIAPADAPVRTVPITRVTLLASKPAGGVTVATLEPPLRVSALGTFEAATLVRAPGGIEGWLQGK